jgi:hypothetical protein
MNAPRCRWPRRHIVAVALVALTGCGADSGVLTSWVARPDGASQVAWETPACVSVSPALTFGIGDVRQAFHGGGFTTNGGFEAPTCTPSTAVAVLPAPGSGTTVDLFDGETRVGRMSHETLWEQRIQTLNVPDAVRVGDTLTVALSHDDTVARALFTFRGGGEPVTVDAERDGLTFSVVVPAAAVGATVIEATLLDLRVPVRCTTVGDFACVFGIGISFEVDGSPAGEGRVEIQAEVPPIAAAP